MNLLPWTIYLSFFGAVVVFAVGRRSAAAAKGMALATAVGAWAVVAFAAYGFVPAAGLQTLVDLRWIPELGIRYHLAADGISMTLLMLTGLAATAGILFSWNIEERPGDYFAFYLTLVGGVYGVFLSADVLLFFVFYEIAIVPKYFLIAIWGSSNRSYGAMKLALYSFAGSALVLAGLLCAYVLGGSHSFGLANMAAQTIHFSAGQQVGLFALVFTGFAILAGLFPFHTWAPTGHVAAPTAASMLLAGVVMKLGAYGCLRIALPLFPAGLAFWQPAIAWLAVTGIVYAGVVALVQRDLKFIVGYSSVSHMGFVLLGIATATPQAESGAVLQMFSHGAIAGLLFAVVGRMVYDRMHTRNLIELSSLALHRLMPFAAGTFVLAGLASMGFPGFSGFPAELTILLGSWQRFPSQVIVAAAGVLIAAAFTIRAIQTAFFGQVGRADSGGAAVPIPAITAAERAGGLLLLATIILIGFKPDLLLDWIVPSLQSPLMQAAIKGGSP